MGFQLSVAEQRILVLEEEKLRTDLLVHNQERELSESNEALRTARENCLRLQNQVTELPKVAIHNSYRAFLNSVCQRACDLLEELLTHFAQSELLLMHKTTPGTHTYNSRLIYDHRFSCSGFCSALHVFETFFHVVSCIVQILNGDSFHPILIGPHNPSFALIRFCSTSPFRRISKSVGFC